MVSVTRQKPITLFIDYLFFYKAILFTNTLLLIEFRKSTIWDVPSPLYLPVSGDMEAAFIPLLPRLEICTPSPVESLQVSPPRSVAFCRTVETPFLWIVQLDAQCTREHFKCFYAILHLQVCYKPS